MQGSAATNQSAARAAKGARTRLEAARLAAMAWNNLKQLESTSLHGYHGYHGQLKSPPPSSSQILQEGIELELSNAYMTGAKIEVQTTQNAARGLERLRAMQNVSAIATNRISLDQRQGWLRHGMKHNLGMTFALWHACLHPWASVR